MVLVLGLVSGTSPVRVQATGAAAGVQAAGRGVTARSAHAHDMSVECGNDASLDYIPLTGDADGKLYIDGTEASINTSSTRQGDYILPEGNYYLADNITVHKGVFIESGKTVKLCLNGKTLQIQTEDGNGLWIGDEGNFYLSDCKGGGRITAGSNVLQSGIDGKFIMYGGCLECTMAGGNVIYFGNSRASAEIYGGTIKSDRGIGIASGESTQCEFSLSGNPVFVGNMVDVNSYVTLHLNALDRNRNERIKVSRDTDLSVGESQALDSICSLDGVDYSTVLTGREGQYFTYINENYFVNRAGVTRQPTPEEVSVDVLPAEGAAYQWYEAAEQDVTADRTIENMSAGSMSATIFTLQAGDTLYFTLPETPIISEEMGGDAVMLYSTEADIIPVTSLGNRRYKGTVESDITFMVTYATESSDLNVALFEEGTYEVKAVTQGDAVVGQTTDTFTKVESGTYLCEITWEDLGCDVTSDLVEITVTDEDKVAAVKAVVEEVLADYTATNGSTREEIQGKINTALSSAGIVGVSVTVGDLAVKKATESEAGSISGSIAIECGSESDSVAVNKLIAKAEVPDKPEVPEAPGVSEAPEMPDNTVPLAVSQKEQEKNALSLNAKLKVSQTGKKINIAWGKVPGAEGYDVYVQYCGKKFTDKSVTAVESGKTTKVTVMKVDGKPLNLKKNYKIYVLAYKLVNDKKGKTAKIKASTVLVSPGKKQLTNAHAKQFRYASTNKKVATVSVNGKTKAVGKGNCIIYVYARNGYAKKIKVMVK